MIHVAEEKECWVFFNMHFIWVDHANGKKPHYIYILQSVDLFSLLNETVTVADPSHQGEFGLFCSGAADHHIQEFANSGAQNLAMVFKLIFLLILDNYLIRKEFSYILLYMSLFNFPGTLFNAINSRGKWNI